MQLINHIFVIQLKYESKKKFRVEKYILSKFASNTY